MSKKQAKIVLNKALLNGGELIINCQSHEAASALRLFIYKERAAMRKTLAKAMKVDEDEVTTDYDDMQFFIKGNRLEIKPAPTFELLDPKTGEKI